MQSLLKTGSPGGTGIGKQTREAAGLLTTLSGQHEGGRPFTPNRIWSNKSSDNILTQAIYCEKIAMHSRLFLGIAGIKSLNFHHLT